MRRMVVAAAASVFVAVTLAWAQAGQGGASAAAEQALVKLTNDWLDAEAKADRATLERLVADDFAGIAPNGRTVSKSDVLPREGTRGGGLAYTAQDVRARVFGNDVGVVTGRGVSRGQGPEMRFTVVYARRQDRWQMVAGHLSGLPPDQP